MLNQQAHVDEAAGNGKNEKQGVYHRFCRWWRQEQLVQELVPAYEDFLHSVKDVLFDFTTMEVNSVLCRSISAISPSTDQELLQETGADLAQWFEEHAQTVRGMQRPLAFEKQARLSFFAQERLKQPFPLSSQDQAALTELVHEVKRCIQDDATLQAIPAQLHEEEASRRSEYRRFLRYLQQFLELCQSDKWEVDTRNQEKGSLPGREHQQLRKLWELVGTEFVYAQTVVGLDSDVVSRVNTQLFHSARRLSPEHIEALIRFHTHSTEASAHGRNSLVAVLAETLRAVIKR
jgi:hypothetical protein